MEGAHVSQARAAMNTLLALLDDCEAREAADADTPRPQRIGPSGRREAMVVPNTPRPQRIGPSGRREAMVDYTHRASG